MKVLLLGASGFIGSAIAAALVDAGYEVTGLGRDLERARHLNRSLNWIEADLKNLVQASDWTPIISGQDAVINASGALQDGPGDDLLATQQKAIMALVAAAEQTGIRRMVQISARTDGAAADRPFLATKRAADEALAQSGLDWVILRPALVLGRNAYGGTALLRALASLPLVTPLVYGQNAVATVALDDVADLALRAVDGRIAARTDLDLASPENLSLEEVVGLHRAWLGLPPNRTIVLPPSLARPVSFLADLAGRLGWRSPLRSTAMAVMTQGVRANPVPLEPPLMTASEHFRRHPSGVQDLWFARLYGLKPILILGLAVFWCLSGIIPFFDLPGAASYFTTHLGETPALALTIVTSLADIALGLATLYRPTVRRALMGQIALALAYLAGGTLLEPGLWADPLGAYVKVLPAILLSIVTLAILEDR